MPEFFNRSFYYNIIVYYYKDFISSCVYDPCDLGFAAPAGLDRLILLVSSTKKTTKCIKTKPPITYESFNLHVLLNAVNCMELLRAVVVDYLWKLMMVRIGATDTFSASLQDRRKGLKLVNN